MSGSHDKLPKLFWVQLALAAFIGVMYLITPTADNNEANASEASHENKNASENLKPIGNVAVKSDKPKSASTGRTGEQVFNGVCVTCHKTGIANAPKIDDKAAWEPRLANGLQGLIDTATKGKGAMPPKGGDANITEEELKATILYMTKQAGFDLSAINVKPQLDKAEDQPIKATTTLPEKKIQTTAVEEAPSTLKIEKPSAPEPPAAPVQPESLTEKPTPADEPMTATEPVAISQPAPATKADLELGKKIYSSSCFACHATGVAGSPKIGDKTAWATRIATGSEALYTSALKGKGVMPAKGGNTSIPDSEIKAAVDYMISESK